MMNMPAVVGPIQIDKIFGGVAGVGDRVFISPETSSKVISGSGDLCTGNFVYMENLFDINTDFAPNVASEPTIFNY
ncbi:spore germination protein [Bacillus sp. SAJ1]|nr:spore germination protein [Bacillus sp. SAJ1]